MPATDMDSEVCIAGHGLAGARGYLHPPPHWDNSLAGARQTFSTIVADPPWPVPMKMGKGGRRARATEIPYSLMSVYEIMALPVRALASEQAHLYLWTTRRLFREGVAAEVARAWGFEPCGELIWGLRNPGMGGFNGAGHEPILLASRGGLPWPKNKLPASVCFWKQLYQHGKVHSAKPDAFLDLVEEVSPAPRVELFARSQRLGWSTWGNECFNNVAMSTGAVAPAADGDNSGGKRP
jgi:N6-adenosine-specific RNA methylase IME4